MKSADLKDETERPARPGEVQPVIQVSNLHKYYDTGTVRVHALRGISVEIHRGEFVAIMGASGSGKSTFMNIAGCLDQPSEGTDFLEGTDVSQHPRRELARL